MPMAQSSRKGPAEQTSSLFGDQPHSIRLPGQIDVTFAKFLKHEKLGGRSLFEGFESLRAVTYSSSAGFIRDLFGDFREIEAIFGSDVSIKGDLSRLTAAQQAGVEAIKDEFGRAGKKLAEMVKENRLRLFYAHYTIHRKVFILEGDFAALSTGLCRESGVIN